MRVLGENTDAMGAASMAQAAQMNEPQPAPQPVADVTQIKEEASSEEETIQCLIC